jgi:gliding motility-associated-like protein
MLKKGPMNKKLSLLVCALAFGVTLVAQPSYDNCNSPVKIGDITKYCSKVGEFTTVDATPSGYGASTCWSASPGDVWFAFRAFASDVNITIIGANVAGTPGGTLRTMQAALYSGVCGGTLQEINCGTDNRNAGILSLYEGGLVVGRDYLLRIDGRSAATGTFQLCINNYFPPARAEQDCNRATIICNNAPFVNQTFFGAGVDRDEADDSCLGEGNIGTSESQSTWYSWVAVSDCKFTFTLTPLNPSDDIDFAVYELPNGINDCSNKKVLRCNATAPPCAGPTGLNLTSTDLTENFNCNAGEDGFCKYIDMEAGKAYTICINNFTNTGIGFSMDWGGCDFVGPTAAFNINPPTGLKCETDFIVTDSSSFLGGRIRSWEWNFGVDAIPAKGSGQGPHKVNYFSFGEKFLTLTLETDLGCKITEVRRIFVEPCCEDLPTLRLVIDSIFDVKCFGQSNGRVVFRGVAGTPYKDAETNEQFYQFSLDGINFAPLKELNNLPAGTYKLYIQDAKGCMSMIDFNINQPPPVVVDAGPDQSVILGKTVTLSASVSPLNLYSYHWSTSEISPCTDCPSISFLPKNSGYHYVTATDENGCFGIDSVYIAVEKKYKVVFPNVISSNGDGINDRFRIVSDESLEKIDLVEIYDRWGGRVYSREDVSFSDLEALWNGDFKGRPVAPGVFVYLVRARFIDGVTKDYSGDLTVLR